MFIFIYLAVYLLLVSVALLSHVIIGRYLKNFQKKVEEGRRIWKQTFVNCGSRVNGRLKRRELRRLRKPHMINAFYLALRERPPEQIEDFLNDNQELIVGLGYRLKNRMMKAYLAYILCNMTYDGKNISPAYDRLMFDYLLDKSVYIRENTLKALYHLGREDSVLYAFEELSDNKFYHNDKLLADGLMLFGGDAEMLAYKLILAFQHFISCYRTAIVNYLSFSGEHRFDSALIYYLENTEKDLDTRCAIIRLLGKAGNDENRQVLIECAKNYNEEEWEVAAVSARLLGGYTKTDELFHTLINSLTSRHWYVRMNSAEALCRIGIDVTEVEDINNGTDEYAKNAINYAMARA